MVIFVSNKRYCVKEGSFITNLDPASLLPVSAHQKAYRLAKNEKNFAGAISALEESPIGTRDLLLHPDLEQRLFRLSRNPLQLPPIRPITDHGCVPPPWDRSKSLILHGRSGLGKTTFARSMMPGALVVSQVDELKRLGEAPFEGIIFDDMNFMGEPGTGKGRWSREWMIHLVDTEYPRSIHGRYYNAIVPAGTSKIFTTNLSPREILLTGDEAIKRRTTSWFVDGQVGQINITVQWLIVTIISSC